MKKLAVSMLSACAVVLSAADVFDIKIESSSRSGVAAAGEKVQVKFTPTLNGKPIPAGYIMTGNIWHDGKKIEQKDIPAEKGFSTVLSLDKPGWAYARFSLKDAKNPKNRIVLSERNYRGTGILVEPEKLQPGRPEPADFDEFWENAFKERDLLEKEILF